MIAGPSGSGKTITGLHFIYGGAQRGGGGVIATLQENPTQLAKTLGGLGWPLVHPAVEVMYRSPVDIYIDEWVHDLLQAVEHTGARRVVIDSLMDLKTAARRGTVPEICSFVLYIGNLPGCVMPGIGALERESVFRFSCRVRPQTGTT